MSTFVSQSRHMASLAARHDPTVTFLALWGAFLSTLLAVVKLREVWRDRLRIDVGHSFTDHPDIGNEIFIRNLSRYPLILSYWELFSLSGYWPFHIRSTVVMPHEGARDIRIEAHSTFTLTFTGLDHFDWKPDAQKRTQLCLRLHIAGRRWPVRRRLSM